MTFDKVLILLMAGFSVLGGIDRILGNKLGLGRAFENGLRTTGELTVVMVGIMCLSPVLAQVLMPVVGPVFSFLGADPAMFAGVILACDMGAAPLAAQMAQSPEAAQLGGIITGSMLGATVCFTIPYALGVFKGEDRLCAAKGILCGVITIPLGVIAGGLVSGFPLISVLLNTVPIILFSALIAVGLWKAEAFIIKCFTFFGWLITAAGTVGLVAAGLEMTTGKTVIAGMMPIEEVFIVVGQIAIVLAGAFPLVTAVTKLLKKPLERIGTAMGLDGVSVAGLVASLANSIATLGMVPDMKRRGKVVNTAFAVSGAFVFGDHMAFTAGFDSTALPGMIVGKLVAGITAVALAMFLERSPKAAQTTTKAR